MKRLVICLAFAAGSWTATAQTITTFDATTTSTNTYPTAINLRGKVAGYYSDATGFHGFVRNPTTGRIKTFNPPADSTVSGTATVFALNDAGSVVGTYTNGLIQTGYLRTRAGVFTDIAPPTTTLTTANSINRSGQVAGTWVDSAKPAKTHGFIWDSTTLAYTSFDITGSTGITVATINNHGDVAGSYYDASFKAHGFYRDSTGTVTTFDAPSTDTYINITGMDDSQEITGFFTPDNNATYQGLVRIEASRKMAAFTADPTATQTYTYGINAYGSIVGYWYPSGAASATGFVRNPPSGKITGTGTFTNFTVPGAAFTQPNSINDNGAIAGIYITVVGNNYYRHGFIRQ